VKLKRVVFANSVEAPGRGDRVAYLQSYEPERKDCYAADLWLSPLGVMAGDEIYPIHMVRRITVDAASAESKPAAEREAFVQAMSADDAPKRRGRPPKQREE